MPFSRSLGSNGACRHLLSSPPVASAEHRHRELNTGRYTTGQILHDISCLDQRLAQDEPVPYDQISDIFKHGLLHGGSAARRADDPTDTEVKAALLDLARSLADQGRLEEAAKALGTIMETPVTQTATESSRQWEAEALTLQSLIAYRRGNDADALHFAQKSVSRYEKLVADFGPSNITSLAGALVNLGCRHHDVTNSADALSTLERAILMARTQAPSLSPLDRCTTLGEALLQAAAVQLEVSPDAAVETAAEALALARAAVLENSSDCAPLVIGVLAENIRIHLTIDRHGPVADYIKELKSLHGEGLLSKGDHDEVAEALMDAGKVLMEHGHYGGAMELVELVTNTRVVLQGATQAEVAFVAAACSSELGLHDRSIHEIQTCIDYYEKKGPSAHQQLASAQNERSKVLLKAGRTQDSMEAAVQAVHVQRQVIQSTGASDPSQVTNLGIYLVVMSQVQLLSQMWELALQAADEAFRICQANLRVPAAHGCLVDAYLARMKALVGLGDHIRVVETADKLQVVLQTAIEEEENAAAAFEALVESIEILIPSLAKLEKESDMEEAKQTLAELQKLTHGGTSA